MHRKSLWLYTLRWQHLIKDGAQIRKLERAQLSFTIVEDEQLDQDESILLQSTMQYHRTLDCGIVNIYI